MRGWGAQHELIITNHILGIRDVQHLLEPFGQPYIVRVERGDPFAVRRVYCSVVGRVHTAIVLVAQHSAARVPGGNLLCYSESGIVGGIVDHDDLEIWHRLGKSGVEGAFEEASGVIGGNDNAHARYDGLIHLYRSSSLTDLSSSTRVSASVSEHSRISRRSPSKS